jgi:hypothetical protein
LKIINDNNNIESEMRERERTDDYRYNARIGKKRRSYINESIDIIFRIIFIP